MSMRSVVLLAAVVAFAVACTSSNPRRPVNEKGASNANVRLGVAYLQQGNLSLAKEKLEKAVSTFTKNFVASKESA